METPKPGTRPITEFEFGRPLSENLIDMHYQLENSIKR